MQRRTWVALAALAASAFAAPLGLRPGQGHQDRPHLQPHRPARGLRQADRDRPDDGPGLRHRRHHDGQRPQDHRDREGRPGQARPGQDRCWPPPMRDDKVDLAIGPTASPRRPGHAAGRRGIQEDPAGRAGRGRLDHRREVEQVHLPHRPQQLAGRDLQRRGAGQAGQRRSPRWPRTTPSAATASRPFKETDQEGQDRARGIPAGRHDRLHRRPAAHHRQAQGPARPQGTSGWSGPAPATRSTSSPTWT